MAKDSTIIFAKSVPIDKGYKDVVNYSSSTMLTALRSQAHFVAESQDYSFVREKKRTIRTSLPFAQAQIVNYIAFRNDSYYAKWYFAFVNNVNFISPNCTEIEFTIDEWTTWFDQFQQKACYTLREHVQNDTIGEHTVNENLSVGDVTCIYTQEDVGLSQYSWICVLSAWKPDDKTGYNGIAVYNGSVFGRLAILFRNNVTGWQQLLYYLLQTNADGHIADVTDMFIVPQNLIEESQLTMREYTLSSDIGGQSAYYYTMQFSDSSKVFPSTLNKAYTWTHYAPKNNKLYCYPWNYLLVSNNNGSQNIYKYEDFSTDNVQFDNELCFSIGVSGRLLPRHYKGMNKNDDESIPLGKYPTCSWSSDAYTNWLTQQAVNVPTQFISLITGLATKGMATKSAEGLVGNVGNLASQVGGLIGQFYQASLLPEIQGGGNTGDVVFNSKRNTFSFRQMTAKPEYLKIADDYFTRFGYAINRVKIPNMTGRQNWNYVEIGQGEIWLEGEIPASSKETINQIARNGVTIWHNLENVGNFNLSNNIVN